MSSPVRPDGLVHLVKEVTTDKGSRLVTPKCSKSLPKFRTQDRLSGASIWRADVTCQECLA